MDDDDGTQNTIGQEITSMFQVEARERQDAWYTTCTELLNKVMPSAMSTPYRFDPLSVASRTILLDCAIIRTFQQGDTIVRQGDAPEQAAAFFVILEGTIVVTRGDVAAPPDEEGREEVAVLSQGATLGDLAILTSSWDEGMTDVVPGRRAVTAVAASNDTRVMAIPVQQFQIVFFDELEVLGGALEWLHGNLLTSHWPLKKLYPLAAALRLRCLTPGTKLRVDDDGVGGGRAGDTAGGASIFGFSFVLDGALRVSAGDGRVVATVGAGDIFGAVELNGDTSRHRVASVSTGSGIRECSILICSLPAAKRLLRDSGDRLTTAMLSNIARQRTAWELSLLSSAAQGAGARGGSAVTQEMMKMAKYQLTADVRFFLFRSRGLQPGDEWVGCTWQRFVRSTARALDRACARPRVRTSS